MPCHMQTAGASLPLAAGGSLVRIEGPRFKSVILTGLLRIRSGSDPVLAYCRAWRSTMAASTPSARRLVPLVIACAARGGSYGTRPVAPVASAEAARQPCGGADGGAGGRTSPGFPCPDPARRGADERRQHAGLGNQRGAVPRGRPLLLQVRRVRPP